MDLTSIFEKVNRKVAITQPEFLTYYNDSISELVNLYGDNFTLGENIKTEAEKLTDFMCVDSHYVEAIVDNIISLEGSSDDSDFKKSEFLRKSKNAYLRLWNTKASGLTLRRGR